MIPMRLTISIDDGHPLDLRMADLLDQYGMQATFYVPIANDEGPPVMDAPQMRTLSQRFEIGSHTLSHQFLARVNESSAWHQIADGKSALEDCLGQRVQGFCYPGGRYRRVHVRQVRAAGFAYARTTHNLHIDRGSKRFELPTTAQFYPHSRGVWIRNFLSQGHWYERVMPLRTAVSETDWLVRLYRLLALAQASGSVFHLWAHSLDLERLQLWEAFERFLGYAAQRVSAPCRVTNAALLNLAPAATPPAAAWSDPMAGPHPPATADWAASPPSTPSGNNAT